MTSNHNENICHPAIDILEQIHKFNPEQVTDEMMQSEVLRKVIQSYLKDPETDARKATYDLTLFLQLFRSGFAQIIYKEIRAPDTIDRDAASDAIRSAAAYLSPNNPNRHRPAAIAARNEQLESLRQEDPSIMDLSRPETLQKLSERELLSHALGSIADALESLSDDQVTPGLMKVQIKRILNVDQDNLKEKGGAHDRDGAMRGFIVRELDRRISADIENRNSTIRHLAAFGGVTMDKSYPRSLLIKGRT